MLQNEPIKLTNKLKMSQSTNLLLQKKLQELESEFTHEYDLSNHLPEFRFPSLNPFVDDFHNRLVFLRKFLTAEIALHPIKPDLLAQIDGRLGELEAAFGRRYMNYLSSSSLDTSSNDDHRTTSLNDGTAGEDDQAGDVGVYDVNVPEEVVVPPAPEPKKTFGYENTMRWDDDGDDYRKVTGGGGGGGSAWRKEDFRVVAFWMMLLGAILIVNFPSFFHSVV